MKDTYILKIQKVGKSVGVTVVAENKSFAVLVSPEQIERTIQPLKFDISDLFVTKDE